MAAITICSDFGVQENHVESVTVSIKHPPLGALCLSPLSSNSAGQQLQRSPKKLVSEHLLCTKLQRRGRGMQTPKGDALPAPDMSPCAAKEPQAPTL